MAGRDILPPSILQRDGTVGQCWTPGNWEEYHEGIMYIYGGVHDKNHAFGGAPYSLKPW